MGTLVPPLYFFFFFSSRFIVLLGSREHYKAQYQFIFLAGIVQAEDRFSGIVSVDKRLNKQVHRTSRLRPMVRRSAALWKEGEQASGPDDLESRSDPAY